MTEALDEVTEQEWEYCIQIENDYHKKFADKGVTIYNFSEQDHKEIISRFDDYWRMKASAMGAGTVEMLDKLIKLQSK
jgi:TRAP-type C4-dicarboxylate transport system substrate-binding protein